MSRISLKKFLRKTVSGFLSMALMLSFIPSAINVGAETVSDFEDVYDAYYSSNMKTVDPTPESMTNHWELNSDATRLSRKTNDSTWTSWGPNMAILYLKKAYYDFDLTTTFSMPYDSNTFNLYFSVGADKGKSWENDTDSSAFTFHISGGLLNGKTGDWITGGGQTPLDRIDGYSVTGVHTLRIKVIDKVYTVWVDDIQVGTGTLSNYSEGYIWFGADDMTASWGIPTVTELNSISDFEDVYDAYYSDNAKTTETMRGISSIASYWTVSDNMVIRNDRDCNWDNSYENLSVLYVNTKKYDSFEMTVDYQTCQTKNQTDRHNNSALVGFGATEMGKSFYFDSNTVTRNISMYGAVCSADTSSDPYWYKAAGTTLKDKISDWDSYGVHTLTLRVIDGTATYIIDGHIVYGIVINNYKEAGYIYFASNEYTTRFGVPEIIELSDTDASGNASSPLYGKKALFVGDSISYGALDDVMGLAWGGRIGIEYGMDWKNASISGTTVANGKTSQIKNQLADGDFDYVVIEGGINDALQNRDNGGTVCKLGTMSDSYDISDVDTSTFGGAFEELLSTAIGKYPNAKIGYLVTFRNPAIADSLAEPYYELAKQICDKWGVEYLDLFNDDEVTDWLITNATTYMPDNLHPNAAAYDLLTPKIAAWMETLSSRVKGDVNGDRTANSDDLVIVRKALLNNEKSVVFNINGNDTFDITDLIALKKIIAGV